MRLVYAGLGASFGLNFAVHIRFKMFDANVVQVQGSGMGMQQPITEEFLVLMADKFRMLGDSTRLAILHSLMGGIEMNVSQIVAKTNRNVANVSKHLKQLAEGGLLSRRKEGSFVLYRMNDLIVEKICSLVCDSLQREIQSRVKQSQRLLKRGSRK